jgi:hypothetical protein
VDSTTTVSATNTEATPWLTATFTDVTGGVQMVLSGAGLNQHDNGVGGGTGSGFQHVGTGMATAANSLGWFFNEDNVDVSTLTFTLQQDHRSAPDHFRHSQHRDGSRLFQHDGRKGIRE